MDRIFEQPYLDLLQRALASPPRETRNGLTHAAFGGHMTFNLEDGFPLLLTKEVNWRLIIAELLWLLEAGRRPRWDRGESMGRLSFRRLEEIYGAPIGQMWLGDMENFALKGKARFEGDCGSIYGAQWRSWRGEGGAPIDQIQNLINLLRSDPTSRYMLVTAWNPAELHDMCLPPCHKDFQCFVEEEKGVQYLSLMMNQRSCDMFLGVPFNIASYALLAHMLAHVTGMKVGKLVINLGDYHLYDAHLPMAMEQLGRASLVRGRQLPTLSIDPRVRHIDGFTPESFTLNGYAPEPAIRGKVLTSNLK